MIPFSTLERLSDSLEESLLDRDSLLQELSALREELDEAERIMRMAMRAVECPSVAGEIREWVEWREKGSTMRFNLDQENNRQWRWKEGGQ